MTDISSGLAQVFSLIFDALEFSFNLLDSITFRGISLLDFSIWVFVLGIILPIVVTLLNSGRSASERYYRSHRSESRHNSEE